jgi:HlyD family secretion protein
MVKPAIFLIWSASQLLFFGCRGSKSQDFMGSAVIEAETFQSATTVQGFIACMNKNEGDPVAQGEVLAIIDTVPLHLQRLQINASLSELEAQIGARQADISAAQLDVAGFKREYDRIEALAEKNSAPRQQADDLRTRHESSAQKLKGTEMTLKSLQARREGLEAQKAAIADQVARCYIRAYVNGVVLTRFKNLGEVAGPGQPLFELGKYDTVQTDFFVPEPLLSGLKIGQDIRIRIDTEIKGEAFLPARIVWISQEAEFAPKNIQTRESRQELVFKVRAMAPNPEGRLKRGLPVEIWK